jgi:hypothetical protein
VLGDEIIVEDAEAVWNMTLDNAPVNRSIDDGVMVTKYADTFTYYALENATKINRTPDYGVMVTKYADTFTYYLLENATKINRTPDYGVMVTRYADTFMLESLTAPPFVPGSLGSISGDKTPLGKFRAIQLAHR